MKQSNRKKSRRGQRWVENSFFFAFTESDDEKKGVASREKSSLAGKEGKEASKTDGG